MIPGEVSKINACPEKILRVLPRVLIEGITAILNWDFITVACRTE
jgi:hypothetical protein